MMSACLVFISFAYMIRYSFIMDRPISNIFYDVCLSCIYIVRVYDKTQFYYGPASYVLYHTCLTCIFIQSTIFIPTIDTTTKFAIMTFWPSRNIRLLKNYARILHLILWRNMCFTNLFESPLWCDSESSQWGDSNKYQNMFCEEIRK